MLHMPFATSHAARIPLVLGALAVAAALEAQTTPAAVTDSVRVRVSRHELRVEFPRDTARHWGWRARGETTSMPAYTWSVYADGMDGSRSLSAEIGRRDGTARRFASLADLVRAAEVGLCRSGMIIQCDPSRARAHVERGRVVLTLRDSAAVSRLFALRPAFVSTFDRQPGMPDRRRDSVRVEYVSPEIPHPTDSVRAEAARVRRAYDASIHRTTREIVGGWGTPLWLQVGDSTTVQVQEWRCRHDACSGLPWDAPSDSGWSVNDTTVAQLRFIAPTRRFEPPRARVTAIALGRTTLHARGLTSARDTMPNDAPPPRELSREILVTPPVGRIVLRVPVDTVRVGAPVPFEVRVFDRSGHQLDGLPVVLELGAASSPRFTRLTPASSPLSLDERGRTRIVARLGAFSDTAQVVVVP